MFAEGSAFGEEGFQIAETVAHPGSLMMALSDNSALLDVPKIP
jgi:hypothetical protein